MTILERFSLSGRTALVTGGGTGIGRALAVALAEAGAAVAVAGRTQTTLDAALKDIRAAGQEGLAVVADVTQADQVERMIGAVVDRWGRLDIAINNAGVNNWVEAVDMSETDWDWAFDTNVKGVFLCAQAEARAMIPTGYGKIINIASMSASIVNRPQPQTHYNASKAAVVHLTKIAGRRVGAARYPRQHHQSGLHGARKWPTRRAPKKPSQYGCVIRRWGAWRKWATFRGRRSIWPRKRPTS